MKNISILIMGLAFLPVSSVLAYTEDDAQNLITLIKRNSQSQFCSAGAQEFIHTIRSWSGAYCDPDDIKGSELQAALALGVCEGFGNFSESKCRAKAIDAIPNAAQNPNGAALSMVLDTLNKIPAGQVCLQIGTFLPDLVDKCKFLLKMPMPDMVYTSVSPNPPTSSPDYFCAGVKMKYGNDPKSFQERLLSGNTSDLGPKPLIEKFARCFLLNVEFSGNKVIAVSNKI